MKKCDRKCDFVFLGLYRRLNWDNEPTTPSPVREVGVIHGKVVDVDPIAPIDGKYYRKYQCEKCLAIEYREVSE